MIDAKRVLREQSEFTNRGTHKGVISPANTDHLTVGLAYLASRTVRKELARCLCF